MLAAALLPQDAPEPRGDARRVVEGVRPLGGAAKWWLHQSLAALSRSLDKAGAALTILKGPAATVVPALPFVATAADVGLLALLGVVQLAIPCLLAVVVARSLPAPEISLLGLLEVIFGVLWAWLGANEAPSASVLSGGALVLAALAGNELLALRERRL